MHSGSSERFRWVRKLSQTPQNSVHSSGAKHKEMPQHLYMVVKTSCFCLFDLSRRFFVGSFFHHLGTVRGTTLNYDGDEELRLWCWITHFESLKTLVNLSIRPVFSLVSSSKSRSKSSRWPDRSNFNSSLLQNRKPDFTYYYICHNFHNTDNFSDQI